jgi:hypothetical protein
MIPPDEERKVCGFSIQIARRFRSQKNVPHSGGVKIKSIFIYIAYSHLHRFFKNKYQVGRSGEEIDICVVIC